MEGREGVGTKMATKWGPRLGSLVVVLDLNSGKG